MLLLLWPYAYVRVDISQLLDACVFRNVSYFLFVFCAFVRLLLWARKVSHFEPNEWIWNMVEAFAFGTSNEEAHCIV